MTQPLPVTITKGTVKGRIVRAVADPTTGAVGLVSCVGALLFTATPQHLDTTGLVVLPDPIPVPIAEDDDGRFSVDLPATDNGALSQVGWTWRVSFALDATEMDAFNFLLPAGSVNDITDLVPLSQPRSDGTVDLRGTTAAITVAGYEPVGPTEGAVVNQGDENNAALYFYLPTGGKGGDGPRGPAGLGAEGYTAQFMYGAM